MGGREVGAWEECTGGQGEGIGDEVLGEEEDYQVSSGGDGVEEQRVGDNDCKKSRVQRCYLCFENHIGLKENFYSQEDV